MYSLTSYDLLFLRPVSTYVIWACPSLLLFPFPPSLLTYVLRPHLLFPENSKLFLPTGPLHLRSPFPRMLFPKVTSSLHSGLCSNTTSLKTILFKGKSLPPSHPSSCFICLQSIAHLLKCYTLLTFSFLSPLVELGQEVHLFQQCIPRA